MAYVIWAYKSSQSATEFLKKARLCAVMSMWLVRIKEHVWSIRTCPTTILLSTLSKWMCKKCCTEGSNDKEVLPHMRCRPECSPGSWSGRGWLPLKKWCDTVWKVAWAAKTCKACEIVSPCILVTALYQMPNITIIIISSNGFTYPNTPLFKGTVQFNFIWSYKKEIRSCQIGVLLL